MDLAKEPELFEGGIKCPARPQGFVWPRAGHKVKGMQATRRPTFAATVSVRDLGVSPIHATLISGINPQ